MDSECAVSAVVMGLHALGWLSLLVSKLTHDRRRTTAVAELLLVVSLLGMGAAILVAALQQTVCALTTGATVTLLLMAVITHPGADPYAKIYASE